VAAGAIIARGKCWIERQAFSRACFIDHRFPDAFGFQDEFNGFADRSVTS
jgi:hypothetical protein